MIINNLVTFLSGIQFNYNTHIVYLISEYNTLGIKYPSITHYRFN